MTNGTSEANYLVALSLIQPGRPLRARSAQLHAAWGIPRSLGADVSVFHLRLDQAWQPDWDEFDRAVTQGTRLVYISNPNNPTGAVLSPSGT